MALQTSNAGGSLFVIAPIPHRPWCRLNTLGYRVGTRVLELMAWRNESSSKAPKREVRFLPALMSIHTQVWKSVFGKPADAIEKSVENPDECAHTQYPFTPSSDISLQT